MEQEMKALTQERDLARSRLEEILRAAGVDQSLLPWFDSTSLDEGSASSHLRSGSWDGRSMTDTSDVAVNTPLRFIPSVNTYNFPENDKLHDPNEDNYLLENLTPRDFMTQYFVPDPTHEWEKTSQKTRPKKTLLNSCKQDCIEKDDPDDQVQNQNEGNLGNENVEDSSVEDVSYLKTSCKKRSTSCAAIIEGDSVFPVSEKNVVIESIAESKSDSDIKKLCRQDSFRSATSVDEKDTQQTEGDIFVLSPSSKTLEKVMKYDLRGTYKDYMETTPKAVDSEDGSKDRFDSDKHWSMVFEEQRKDIIEFWHECNIPLIHRTYFFMLIKGDPSDFVYIEVELRRLSFLKKTVDHAASERALNLERAMLSRKLLRKFTSKEREAMFEKWGIDLESKNRRVQLSQLLWTKTDDMDHIRDSAEIVATLVGLIEPDNTPKELFALSYAPKQTESHNILSTWRNSLNLLRY